MFGSQILDIAIAMILFYLFISLICSAIREGLEVVTKVRAMNVERGIRQLLNDPSGTKVTQHLFDHPMLSGLFQGKYKPVDLVKTGKTLLTRKEKEVVKNLSFGARKDLPSYVPASNFAIALLDITAKGDCATPPPGGAPANPLAAPAISLDAVRGAISTLPSPELQRAVLSAVERANGDLAQAQKHLEDWFDSTMDRVSGWYKQRTQIILFGLGLAAAIVFNFDTFAILDVVSNDKAVREGMIAIADTAKNNKENATYLKQLSGDFQKLNLPMGWEFVSKKVVDANTNPPAQSVPAKPVHVAGATPSSHVALVGSAPPAPKPDSKKGAEGSKPGAPSSGGGDVIKHSELWQWWADNMPEPLPQSLHCEKGRCDHWMGGWDIVKMILGWIITGAAVTLGAPFWFDTLSKFMSVRSSLKPESKAATEPAPAATPTSAGGTSGAVVPPAPPPAAFTPNEWNAGYAMTGDL